ncbi:MAG: Crp/Fnr family transcriptional regulator [Propionicimonas sp.]|uniref:Crp/Fnr family transcriptional regulator n=1 Tax=Propionicimonas sp. TaxID=1955623 RepID=UPI003D105D55
MDGTRRRALVTLRALAVAAVGGGVDDGWDEFEDACDVVAYGARETIVEAGARHRYAYLIDTGLVKLARAGRNPSTLWLAAEGQVVTLFGANPLSLPGQVFDLNLAHGHYPLPRRRSGDLPLELVAVEPTTALRMDLAKIETLAGRNIAWGQLVNLALNAELAFFTRLALWLRAGSAEQRYERFVSEFPDLTRRVSQKELALLLDVSPVTLSRVTARLRDRATQRSVAQPQRQREHGQGH